MRRCLRQTKELEPIPIAGASGKGVYEVSHNIKHGEMRTDRIILSPPHMGGRETEFVREAFESNFIVPLGPMVDAFEAEFSQVIGGAYTLALSSGTAAMHLALREFGVRSGDEVLASTLTFIGGVSPITFLGATPVFIDADRATWNLDPNLLVEELAECARRGRLPKAVVPTDLYGQCADLDRIRAACASYDVPVIVDSAEAVGATYKGRHAGAGAQAAVYSFNGNKIITTSGGGMLASDDKALIEHARKLSTQARDPAPWYEHTEIGYNYRMSNISAAIGRGQLQVLGARVKKKRQIFSWYFERLRELPGFTFMPEASYGQCTRWLTVVLIGPCEFGASPSEVRAALDKENIEARPVWKPMHLQPVFRDCRCRGGKVAEDLFERGLCLPSGTALTEEDVDRVCRILRGCAHQG